MAQQLKGLLLIRIILTTALVLFPLINTTVTLAEEPKESIESIQKKANDGDQISQCRLGFLYFKGEGVPKNFDKAIEWCLKAQEGNDIYYWWFFMLELKDKQAIKFLKLVAEHGVIEAQNTLGDLYSEGKSVPQDYSEAIKWYKKAAGNGLRGAETQLGELYEDGKGVPQDLSKAVEWYRKAEDWGKLASGKVYEYLLTVANQGDINAQYALGATYRYEQDEKALVWFKKAAEQGHIEAQFNAGIMYSWGDGTEKNEKEAFKWTKKAAEQGHSCAQYNLGIHYDNGDGVRQDKKEAVKWYRKSAEQGWAIAQYALGSMYDGGEGVAQDKREAVKWYRKAAKQGNSDAQFYLGVKYDDGEGVLKDDKEAVKWYRKAAKQGNSNAQINLGIIYFNGEVIPQNYIRAYAWTNLAAVQGHPSAVNNRKVISKKMSKSQIAKAQELSKAISEGEEIPPAFSDKEVSDQIKGIGTGFFVTRNGHILTCYHVVKGSDSIKINLEDKTYNAELVIADSHNDLALLKINGFFPALAFSPSRTASLGDEVFTVGFPNPRLQGLSAKFTKGDINSLTGVQDDPRLYQISAPVHPGNSGGALINSKSEVVGCVVSTLDAKTAFKISGSIPQNVNYAIKSTYILAFLDAIPNVSSKLVQQDKRRKKSFNEAVAEVKASTVMVVTY